MHEVHPELLRYTREMARRLEDAPRRRPRRAPRRHHRPDPAGHRRAAGPGGSAAGDPVHLQPGRLRRRRAAVPARRAAADRPGRAGRDPPAWCEARTAAIPSEDLTVLGYWEWLDGLERGLAAHHAGMLPAFKEVVEELFVRGLVKAVFATETLALGINMPARCVVLERLVKFNGEAHVDLTPGEYTQLTGRAGRRGIDVEGHAVVIWSPEVDPRHVAGLASTRTYPLRSSFRPSYNMAVNLVGSVGHGGRARAAGVVVRPVPGRPVGGRAGPPGAAQRGDDGGCTRSRWACDAGRLRRVLRDPPAHRRAGEGAGPPQRGAAAGGRGRVAGAAQGRRRDPGAVRAPGRAGGRARPGRRRLRRAAAAGAHRGPVGRADQRRASSPPPVERAGPGPGAEALQPPRPRRSGATWPPRCARRSLEPAWPARPGRAAPRRRRGRRAGRAAARSCAATRATPARTGRSTPAGPSGGPGWSATPRRCGRRWPAAPVRWPAPSTGSARCWRRAATCADGGR